MSVAQSVRGTFGRINDMMAVSEEPLVQHQFNPTARFHTVMIVFNIAASLIGLYFRPLGIFGVCAIFVSCLFLLSRFCSGYKVNTILMWCMFGLAVFSAMMISAVPYYGSIYAATDGASGRTGIIAVTVLGSLTLYPYLIISSIVLRKFRDISLLQNAPAMNIVIPPQPEADPTAPRNFPVDVVQSDGSAVIQV